MKKLLLGTIIIGVLSVTGCAHGFHNYPPSHPGGQMKEHKQFNHKDNHRKHSHDRRH